MQEEQKIEKKFYEKTNELKVTFQNERNKWTEKIQKLSKMLKFQDKFVDLEIEIHNEIMNAINDKVSLSNYLINLNKVLRQKKYEKFIEIKTEIDLKIKNKDDQNYVLENSIKDLLEREEVLLLQIEYMNETIKNLKDILWGIKNFIEVKKLFE